MTTRQASGGPLLRRDEGVRLWDDDGPASLLPLDVWLRRTATFAELCDLVTSSDYGFSLKAAVGSTSRGSNQLESEHPKRACSLPSPTVKQACFISNDADDPRYGGLSIDVNTNTDCMNRRHEALQGRPSGLVIGWFGLGSDMFLERFQ